MPSYILSNYAQDDGRANLTFYWSREHDCSSRPNFGRFPDVFDASFYNFYNGSRTINDMDVDCYISLYTTASVLCLWTADHRVPVYQATVIPGGLTEIYYTDFRPETPPEHKMDIPDFCVHHIQHDGDRHHHNMVMEHLVNAIGI